MLRSFCAVGLIILSITTLSNNIMILSDELASQAIGGDIPCSQSTIQVGCFDTFSGTGGCEPVVFGESCAGDCTQDWFCSGTGNVTHCVGVAYAYDLKVCEEDAMVECGRRRTGLGTCAAFFDEYGDYKGCQCPDYAPTFDPCSLPGTGTTDSECVPKGTAFLRPLGGYKVFATLGGV